MPEPSSRVATITAGTNPVTGVDHIVIEYQDGTQQVHARPWSEARELADRAGLEYRQDGPVGVTRWSRR